MAKGFHLSYLFFLFALSPFIPVFSVPSVVSSSDDLVKSLKRRIPVIPANPGSSPGQAPESSYFKYLKILWTPVSTGVTTFYENINSGLSDFSWNP